MSISCVGEQTVGKNRAVKIENEKIYKYFAVWVALGVVKHEKMFETIGKS